MSLASTNAVTAVPHHTAPSSVLKCVLLALFLFFFKLGLQVYADFSHITWFTGKDSAAPWLDDLVAVLAKFNPVTE